MMSTYCSQFSWSPARHFPGLKCTAYWQYPTLGGHHIPSREFLGAEGTTTSQAIQSIIPCRGCLLAISLQHGQTIGRLEKSFLALLILQPFICVVIQSCNLWKQGSGPCGPRRTRTDLLNFEESLLQDGWTS